MTSNSTFRKGSFVKFKNEPSSKRMRVVATTKEGAVIVEHLSKTDYRGKLVRTKPGKGVLQEVNSWELVKARASKR